MEAPATARPGFVGMPREIVEHIADFTNRLGDLASWSSAVGVVVTTQAQLGSLVEAVPIERLLAAGAPVCVLCRRAREPLCDHHLRRAVVGGHVDVDVDTKALELIHDAAIRHLGRCHCGRAAKHAIKSDDARLATWLHQHRDDAGLACDEAHNIVRHIKLDRLVWQGKWALARWLLATRPATPDTERLRKGQIVAAARAGRLGVTASAHANGIYPCLLRALAVAARCGRTDMLLWALGDAVDGVEPVQQAPVASWHGTQVAYSAARVSALDAIHAITSKRLLSAALTPGVARCAFCRGAPVGLIVDLNRNGTVAFSSWDPLETAIQYRDIHELKVLLTAGAPYKKDTIMRAALARPRHDILAYLCKECGPGGLQSAVDALCGLSYKCLVNNIIWVRDHIGAVCVADALASCKVDQLCWCRSCRRCCARCAPHLQ
ncbi:hypothetical protein pneo_cds_493 [Pandoravirus neocaledonia]|uniref:Ankyrin repeat domain containing protein n=1 Tax=Pandoravirus neocaledonia TaxID=2107708 RepID=A0A2U7UCN8_9VIRU|nr:hypothetical protein pneo_cds_493 [Pandoravirus neocaledonia]AVK76100.1 hypothetical protein pneo_cds_493 [Pandoravirus neocaledonia]